MVSSDAAASDSFGYAIAASGNTLLIGAPDKSSRSGAAYTFTNSGGVWEEEQKLNFSGISSGDLVGAAVALEGNIAVIGAHKDDKLSKFDCGAVYAFSRSGGVWTEDQLLFSSDFGSGDFFGFSVAISGDDLIVGASRDRDAGLDSGSAYTFTRSAGVWAQSEKLTASNAAEYNFFGSAVSISNDTSFVGAPLADAPDRYSGAVYIYSPPVVLPSAAGESWTLFE